jgi:hypothetical protein
VVEERPDPELNFLRRSGSMRYLAPDEMVLLDESFQETHCFWASYGASENRNMIGVHFIPVTGIRTNDIRGVFWIDAGNYELRRLDFIYTQVIEGAGSDTSSAGVRRRIEPGLTNPEPGGTLDFSRLDDGSFIIPNWRIYVNDTWTARALPAEVLATPRIGKETGGIVLKVEPPRQDEGEATRAQAYWTVECAHCTLAQRVCRGALFSNPPGHGRAVEMPDNSKSARGCGERVAALPRSGSGRTP